MVDFKGFSVEWHRFDLKEAERRSVKALGRFEEIFRSLERIGKAR